MTCGFRLPGGRHHTHSHDCRAQPRPWTRPRFPLPPFPTGTQRGDGARDCLEVSSPTCSRPQPMAPVRVAHLRRSRGRCCAGRPEGLSPGAGRLGAAKRGTAIGREKGSLFLADDRPPLGGSLDHRAPIRSLRSAPSQALGSTGFPAGRTDSEPSHGRRRPRHGGKGPGRPRGPGRRRHQREARDRQGRTGRHVRLLAGCAAAPFCMSQHPAPLHLNFTRPLVCAHAPVTSAARAGAHGSSNPAVRRTASRTGSRPSLVWSVRDNASRRGPAGGTLSRSSSCHQRTVGGTDRAAR